MAGDSVSGGCIMSDPIKHFRLAIAAAGLEAPDDIHADGAIHRFTDSARAADAAMILAGTACTPMVYRRGRLAAGVWGFNRRGAPSQTTP